MENDRTRRHAGETASPHRARRQARHGVTAPTIALCTVLLVTTVVGCVASTDLRVTIVNTSSTPDNQVYVMLTGNGDVHAGPVAVIDDAVRLDSLPAVAGTPHAYELTVGAGISAGLLWLSFGAPVSNNPRPDVNTSTTRFANVELAFPGQADLTNVDQFSVPMELATTDAAGSVKQKTSYGAGTDCILRAIRDEMTQHGGNYDAAVKTSSGQFLRVVSPSHQSAAWPSMSPYLASMKGRTITVKGHFGNNSYPAESGYYVYSGAFDPTSGALTLTGTVAATGADGSGGRAGRTFTATAAELAASVYDQAGSYRVPGDPVPSRPPSPNDVYGSIYRDVISGFAWGYWGGRYGDDNTAFWGKPAFAAARPAGESFVGYSTYSKVLWDFTTAYSMPFGEAYGSGGHPSPLLDIPAGTAGLRVTILPDTTPGGCPAR